MLPLLSPSLNQLALNMLPLPTLLLSLSLAPTKLPRLLNNIMYNLILVIELSTRRVEDMRVRDILVILFDFVV